jgi:hypothetical protein
MAMWAEFVDLIHVTLFCVPTAFGGSMGWAITMPDALLAFGCAAVTAWSSALAPSLSASQRVPAVAVPALLTFLFLSRMAAGMSIYTLVSGLVGGGQAVLVRRHAARILTA